MKTSAMWWEEVLGNQSLLIDWLKKQYHGEVTAAVRIIGFRDAFALKEKHKKTLTIIASQEELHAAWVGELLTSRGIIPETLNKQERYWDSTLPGIEDFATGSAVASHAERMRLDRIRVIASHPNTPDDIRKVFEKILPQEIFHEKAFEKMAGDQAMKKTLGHHQKDRRL
jgi:rubrerythrin